MIVALAGGVGGARLAYGLSRVLPTAELLVVVNTGDDFEHLGLSISPDLDSVCYTLAELDDMERGWGRAGETWHCMQALAQLTQPDWFKLGDADLALHLTRTRFRAAGMPLGEITRRLCDALGVATRVVPMSDSRIETIVHTVDGALAFQDYFVRHQCRPAVCGFEYRGAAAAPAHPELLQALAHPRLDAVLLCPSNPWLSIAPMLAIDAIAEALRNCAAPVIAVSPIVDGKAVKGPAAKLMAELGLEISVLGIARHYAGIVDTLVIDSADSALAPSIEALGIGVQVTETVMTGRTGRIQLATKIVAALQ